MCQNAHTWILRILTHGGLKGVVHGFSKYVHGENIMNYETMTTKTVKVICYGITTTTLSLSLYLLISNGWNAVRWLLPCYLPSSSSSKNNNELSALAGYFIKIVGVVLFNLSTLQLSLLRLTLSSELKSKYRIVLCSNVLFGLTIILIGLFYDYSGFENNSLIFKNHDHKPMAMTMNMNMTFSHSFYNSKNNNNNRIPTDYLYYLINYNYNYMNKEKNNNNNNNNDNNNNSHLVTIMDCHTFPSFNFVLIGVFYLITCSLGLMITYLPNTTSHNNDNNNNNHDAITISPHDNDTNITEDSNLQSLMQPLLSNNQHNDNNNDDNNNSDENININNHVNCNDNMDVEENKYTNNHHDNDDSTTNHQTTSSSSPSIQPSQPTDNGNTTQIAFNASSRISSTQRLIQLAGPQSFYLYIGCIVLLIRLPFSLSIPHFVGTTLSLLAQYNYQTAKTNILYLFILGTIDALLDFWCVFLFGLANLNIVKGLRIDAFAAILRQDVAFFDNIKTGELVSRLASDCSETTNDLTWFLRFSVESVVRITGILTYMIIRSPKLGLWAISVAPIVAFINKQFGNFLRDNAKATQTALAAANSVAQEAFSCIRTIISFATEQNEIEKYSNKIDVHFNLNLKQLYAQGIYYMAISTFLINTCVQALLLYVGLVMIEDGELTADILLAFMLYQSQLQSEIVNLFNSFMSLLLASGAGDKVFALIDRDTPVPGTGSREVMAITTTTTTASTTIIVDDHDDCIMDDDHSCFTQQPCNVSIRNVSFAYPSRPQEHVLFDINLDIPAGKTIALVGPSGSGKSSIISLLLRFYDPSNGNIFVDGMNLKDINLHFYRQKIGIVTQEPVLFSGTILSNITYGVTNASTEEIIRAAKLANAHEFIDNFPEKYDTEVGERGNSLSGGQRQRIAIARAIIANPSLLLLDEATSALDSESEKLVQEALDHLLSTNKGMTTIMIAHRLSTIRNVDYIIVLDQGHIVERGCHDELMSKSHGVYRKMIERATAIGSSCLTD